MLLWLIRSDHLYCVGIFVTLRRRSGHHQVAGHPSLSPEGGLDYISAAPRCGTDGSGAHLALSGCLRAARPHGYRGRNSARQGVSALPVMLFGRIHPSHLYTPLLSSFRHRHRRRRRRPLSFSSFQLHSSTQTVSISSDFTAVYGLVVFVASQQELHAATDLRAAAPPIILCWA